jgi:hypothetical protein
MTTGIRDARVNGFNSTTHGDSSTAMATSTGSMAIAGDGTTEPIKTTTGIRAVGDAGINSKTAGDFETSTATSTGSMAIAGDGIMGGFMVRRLASITTVRPATIETTISSSNRKNGKANSRIGVSLPESGREYCPCSSLEPHPEMHRGRVLSSRLLSSITS